MDIMFLAKTAATKVHASTVTPFHPLTRFPAQGDLLAWCQEMGVGTCILISLVGVVYLLYGWSLYRPLIALNAALVGGYIGVLLGDRAGGYFLAGGLIGAGVAAAIAWPMMKWAVAVMGGVCGAFVGASVWLTAGQQPDLAWAGAMTGLVGFGMLSFILFRGGIIMYTSLQGALMVIIGLLGLVFKHTDFLNTLKLHMTAQPLALPLAILLPMIIGLIYQQTHSPSGAGAGGGGGDDAKKK